MEYGLIEMLAVCQLIKKYKYGFEKEEKDTSVNV